MRQGKAVKWRSQAAGSYIDKIGEIVLVIPPKTNPKILLFSTIGEENARRTYNLAPFEAAGIPRDHESYLVSVSTGKTSKAKASLYWPRVSSLVKVMEE